MFQTYEYPGLPLFCLACTTTPFAIYALQELFFIIKSYLLFSPGNRVFTLFYITLYIFLLLYKYDFAGRNALLPCFLYSSGVAIGCPESTANLLNGIPGPKLFAS